ncbi:MAG: DNA mismatch repair protein MutS [Chitinophagia bacterium]|nr:DNA mismatch repair protein MutS [Chitinophagia bacterium]
MAKKDSAETPLMRQHNDIKARYPDAVLLFRVGDFYETFGEDALVTSRVLGITLTKRSNGAAASMELAGFPYHSLDAYLHKLVKAGHRVAICDQLEDPKFAKGIVKRGVTELVTPGIATGDKMLETKSNNFLAALHLTDTIAGVAFLDITTGEFFTAEGTWEYMDKLLQSFQPAEILVSKAYSKRYKESLDTGTYTFYMDDWIFKQQYATDILTSHFQIAGFKGFGIDDMLCGQIACGAALHYVKDTEHDRLQHLNAIQRIVATDFLWMDRFTIRNLELVSTASEHGTSLLQAIDNTHTPMGARMLKRWLLFPLFSQHKIEERLHIVTYLKDNADFAAGMATTIKQIGDLERLAGKISLNKANPRELKQLARSLTLAANLRDTCTTTAGTALALMVQPILPLTDICQRINATITDDAPVVLAKGGVINSGVNEELDKLRQLSRSGKDYLLQIQQKEIINTGITSLKVAFNNVFGYYLEVTNAHKYKVPADWIRKQTLTNAERYITPELKEYEDKILGAEEKIDLIEAEEYRKLMLAIEPYIAPIQANAHIIAQIDCLLCFAFNAQKYNYCMPAITTEPILQITAGRHTVIEQKLPAGTPYIPNDLILNKTEQQIIILTGPNMSGKSALLRQTALITLMAHIGSYVPATEALVGLTDKIFTRVGASDNLSGGESTFMVEMNETAGIINNVTDRSLVLLDEIGRGTSTYDGISLAWSIVEFLHNTASKPKTLFATHYHELNEMENQLERVKNYHITHKETGNKVIFLRKMAKGGSRHSFGIQVARMAGMPQQLLIRASEILKLLEEKHQSGNDSSTTTAQRVKHIPPTPQYQLSIFDGITEDMKRIRQILEQTDINTLTPVEALLKLNELKQIAKQ